MIDPIPEDQRRWKHCGAKVCDETGICGDGAFRCRWGHNAPFLTASTLTVEDIARFREKWEALHKGLLPE